MRHTNFSVVVRFFERCPARTKNVISTGKVLYSYGEHFPMAAWAGSQLLVNKDRYSNTTTQHQAMLRYNIRAASTRCVEVDTEELRKYIRSGDSTVVLVRHPESWEANLSGLIEKLGKREKIHWSWLRKIEATVKEAVEHTRARVAAKQL